MHSHRRAEPGSVLALRLALAVVAPMGVITLVAMILLWPAASSPSRGEVADDVHGTVAKILREPCPEQLPSWPEPIPATRRGRSTVPRVAWDVPTSPRW